jgi:hypothetical protein
MNKNSIDILGPATQTRLVHDLANSNKIHVKNQYNTIQFL